MKLIPTFLAIVLSVSACSENPVPPSDGPIDIPFDLIYPPPVAAASYYGAAGFRLSTTEDFRDTIIRVTTSAIYAQFFAAPGIALPASVHLNGIELERHLTTDTLRFDGSPDQSLFGIHTWRLTDDGSPTTFASPALQIIDSVNPLFAFEPLRGDTALVLSWNVPTTGSNGVLITWRSPGVETYSQIVADLGRFAIPASVVSRFIGDSELILSRFRTDSHTYKGKQMFLTRVAQRNYKVLVLN